MAARPMKVLVATDAWHPQVNGVVRTLGSLARAAGELGTPIKFLSPEEAAKATASNDALVSRPWELWKSRIGKIE